MQESMLAVLYLGLVRQLGGRQMMNQVLFPAILNLGFVHLTSQGYSYLANHLNERWHTFDQRTDRANPPYK
jgi:hypothetical protein